MRRLSILLVLALVPAMVASITPVPRESAVRRVPAICQVDTGISNYTLSRIERVLESTEDDSLSTVYRSRFGLNGLAYANVAVVQDSATCAAVRMAYAINNEPDDTVARRYFLEAIPGIFVVRLSPNRLVATVGILDRWYLYEHYLFDSTYALIAKYM